LWVVYFPGASSGNEYDVKPDFRKDWPDHAQGVAQPALGAIALDCAANPPAGNDAGPGWLTRKGQDDADQVLPTTGPPIGVHGAVLPGSRQAKWTWQHGLVSVLDLRLSR
jgi:hypothetical protein